MTEGALRGSLIQTVAACLARMDSDQHGAIVHRRDEAALCEAAEIDSRGTDAMASLPLAGLCFTAKAALGNGEMPSTAGSLLLSETVKQAAPAVRRLREAGAILVGVTNCAEFALTPTDHNLRYGSTLNPRSPGRTPGGSSSGCVAAVAAGIVPLSIGTDYGGSVRYPAHCTGVFGLRPPRRLVPASGQVPAPPTGSPRHRFSVPGVVANDTPILLAAVQSLLGRPILPARPAIVAWVAHDDDGACDDGVTRAVEGAAVALGAVPATRLGGNPLSGANQLFTRIRATDSLEPIRTISRGREDQLSDPMRRQLELPVLPLDGPLEQMLSTMRRHASAFFQRCPVLIAPVATVVAPPAGADVSFDVLSPCRATSLLGIASVSVPFRCDPNGIPIGVQVAGRLPEVIWAAQQLASVATPN